MFQSYSRALKAQQPDGIPIIRLTFMDIFKQILNIYAYEFYFIVKKAPDGFSYILEFQNPLDPLKSG